MGEVMMDHWKKIIFVSMKLQLLSQSENVAWEPGLELPWPMPLMKVIKGL
ncbi:MAG: hypothetical protein ACJAQT_004306 [Akkermansiaceae bacterium]|jgi:hypothetical protein